MWLISEGLLKGLAGELKSQRKDESKINKKERGERVKAEPSERRQEPGHCSLLPFLGDFVYIDPF